MEIRHSLEPILLVKSQLNENEIAQDLIKNEVRVEGVGDD